MTDESVNMFRCPHCNRGYKWSGKLAGRHVKCKCGAKLEVPADPQAQPEAKTLVAPNELEAGTYEMAEHPDEGGPAMQAAATSGHGKCPACNQPIRPGAVICVKCGFNLASGKRMQTQVAQNTGDMPAPRQYGGGMPTVGLASPIINASEEEEQRTERRYRFKEFYLPLIMTGFGIIFILGGSTLLNANPLEGLAAGGFLIGVQVLVMMPLFLLSIFIAAKILDADFGLLHTALLKLTGICLGSGAIGDAVTLLVMPFVLAFSLYFLGIFGLVLAFFSILLINLIAIGIPLALMFDLDFHETSWTIVIVILVRGASIALLTMVIQ